MYSVLDRNMLHCSADKTKEEKEKH